MAASSAAIAPSRSSGTADARPAASGAGGARSTDAARDACTQAPSHSRSALAGRDGDGVDRQGDAVEIQGLARAAHRDDLEVGVGQQRGGLAAERRMPEHDDPLDGPAELRLAKQRPVAVHEVAAEPRTAHDLGDERPAAACASSSASGPASAPARTIVRGPRTITNGSPRARAGCRTRRCRRRPGTARRRSRPRRAPRRARHRDRRRARPSSSTAGAPNQDGRSPASGSRYGRFRCTGPGRPRARAEGRGKRLFGDVAQHQALLSVTGVVDRVRHRQIGFVPHRRCEHAGLAGGLVRADAAQLGRAVGGQQQQWHAGVVCLERGRQQVRDRGARRADDGCRHPGLSSDAERREAGDALVDAHVQLNRSASLELRCDEGERLRARSRAQHDVLDAEFDQPAQQRGRGVGRGGRAAGVPRSVTVS